MNFTNPGKWAVLDHLHFVDERGELFAFELGNPISFSPRRVYVLTSSNIELSRGNHAHKLLKQYLVAINSPITVFVTNGNNQESITLNPGDKGLYLEGLVWRKIDFSSSDAVCVVAASEVYDEEDYIRDFSTFLELVGGKIE
jgi:hypothetical protein